ncbi:MAG: helix-turn-helix domain-containing protein [Candidatus Eremiobacterota bacterium]
MSFERSPCPVAAGLDLLGDRWTLVVLRDLFRGLSRFGDFLESPEGISTNILAERLKRLECAGLIERRRYQERPPRDEYALTRRGAETLPILQALARWANRHLEGTWLPPGEFFEWTPDRFASD